VISYYPSGSVSCTNNVIEWLSDKVITRDRISLSWDYKRGLGYVIPQAVIRRAFTKQSVWDFL